MRDLQTLARETREFTIEDPKKTWGYFFSTIVVLVATVAGTTVGPLWLRFGFSLVTGLVIVRVFIFYHDYLHGALFRQSRLAKFLMSVYGVLILNPPNVWKRSHNYHHQHNAQIATASIGSYPVLTVKQYSEASTLERIFYRLARHPLTILFGYFFIFIIGMCTKSFLTDPKRHFDSLISLVVHAVLTFGLAALFGVQVMLLSYWIPLFVACAAGAYLFYIQHNFPGVELRPRQEWNYLFAALRSSSYMEGSPLLHWFTGNIGYHHVHHLNSQIPFYRLPEAMAAVPELRDPLRTSLKPSEIYRCFQLKLWDPEQGKMVGFPKRGMGVNVSHSQATNT
jgi:acyl-lipid omega-6 desaturase (Delta-12 desaturase)